MKNFTTTSSLFGAITLALALQVLPALAQADNAMAKQDMDHHDAADMAKADTADMIKADGTVLAIDVDALKVNLEHDPIPELNWPAMKMPFSVKDATLLEGLNVDDRVQFTLDAEGASQTITSLTVLK